MKRQMNIALIVILLPGLLFGMAVSAQAGWGWEKELTVCRYEVSFNVSGTLYNPISCLRAVCAKHNAPCYQPNFLKVLVLCAIRTVSLPGSSNLQSFILAESYDSASRNRPTTSCVTPCLPLSAHGV